MERPTIVVKMLGGFSLSVGDDVVGAIPGRQAISLLAYLICHRDKPHTRDLLIGEFWPELDEATARRRLSHTLWQIGSACTEAGTESVLDRVKETVSLRSDVLVTVDCEIFDARLDELENYVGNRVTTFGDASSVSKFADAVAEYDDFLAGYYGAWIDFERLRLAERHRDALEMLVKIFKNCSDYDAALRHARQLVTVDPLREESHSEVIRLCGLTGQISSAKRQYENCVEVFRREVGAEPSEEIRELLRRVEQEAQLGDEAEEPAAKEPLFGRADVLSELRLCVDEMTSGRGCLVLLEGDMGMGKTRVINEFKDGARWRGAEVISASHNEHSRLTPYGSLCQAIAPFCDGLRGEHVAEQLEPMWVAQIQNFIPQFGVERSGLEVGSPYVLKGQEAGLRAAEALARVVLALGRIQPTVLILEDLQWADAELMGALTILNKDLAASEVLVCLTFRSAEAQNSEPIRRALAELGRGESVKRFELEPLSDENMRRLIRSRSSHTDLSSGVSEDKLLDVVHGNPMYAMQVLEHPEPLRSSLTSNSDVELAVADGMAQVVRQRVETAGHGVRTVLELLAVLNEPAGSKLVSRLTGVQRDVVAANMHEAVAARFLVESIDGCCFVNKETRRLVYEQIDHERRAQLHSDVSKVLSKAGGETDELLGHHAWRAGRWAEAFEHHRNAARSSVTLHAYKTARRHFDFADQAAAKLDHPLSAWFDDVMVYENSLDILAQRSEQAKILERLEPLQLDAENRLEVELRRVRLLAHTSKYQESAKVANTAISEAERLGQHCGEIRSYAGASLFWSGNPSAAVDVLQAAVEELNEAGMSSSEPSIWLAKALIEQRRFAEAREVLDKGAGVAKPHENLRFRVDALAAEAAIYMYEGTGDRGLRLYKESLRLSQKIGYLRGEAVSSVNLGLAHGLVGKTALALQYLEAAQVITPILSDERGTAITELNIAGVYHRLLGDDDRALDLATKAAVYFRGIADARMEALCLDTLAGISLRRGRRSKAKAMLADALERKDVGKQPWSEGQIVIALCDVHLQLEEYDDALACAERGFGHISDFTDLGMLPILLSMKALALAKLGRRSDAEAVLDDMGPVSSGHWYAYLTAWRLAVVFEALGNDRQRIAHTKLAYFWLVANLAELTAKQQSAAWTEVPEHVLIAEAYQRLVPIVGTFSMPRATDGGISGELVDVDLTISDPLDWELDVASDRRRHRLERINREAITQGAAPRLVDLAGCFDVSERTIKRDFVTLRTSNPNCK